MSLLSRGADTLYALRFLRLLTTKWEDTNAYKHGIVDENGKQLMKSREVPREHKQYYTIFHRLVFNVRRLLQKIPLIGRSILTNYAAGLLMLREELGLSEEELIELLSADIPEFKELYDQSKDLDESNHSVLREGMRIKANRDLIDLKTFEPVVRSDSYILVQEQVGNFAGIPVYKGIHENTNLEVLLTAGDCMDNHIKEQTAVTTTGVGNVDIALVRKPKSRRYTTIDVDDETYARFVDPKKKFKRWSDYISTDNDMYSEVRKCVKRGDMVILRDSKGNACSVRNYK